MLLDGHQGRVQRKKKGAQRGEGGITKDSLCLLHRSLQPRLFVVLALHVTETCGIWFRFCVHVLLTKVILLGQQKSSL